MWQILVVRKDYDRSVSLGSDYVLEDSSTTHGEAVEWIERRVKRGLD